MTSPSPRHDRRAGCGQVGEVGADQHRIWLEGAGRTPSLVIRIYTIQPPVFSGARARYDEEHADAPRTSTSYSWDRSDLVTWRPRIKAGVVGYAEVALALAAGERPDDGV